MAKKRLSDLLREEVNKSADEAEDKSGQLAEPSSAEPSESSAKPASNRSKAAHKQGDEAAETDLTEADVAEIGAEIEAETKTAPPPGEPLRLGVHPNQQHKNQQSKADAPVASQPGEKEIADSPVAHEDAAHQEQRRHSPTKADLETTIAELKTQLQAAQQHQQETQFNQQIDRLQAEVKRQQSKIEQLQTEVQQSQSLKAELEEARQVILKLSDINAKPVDAKYASKDSSQEAGKNSAGKDSAGKDTNGATQAANAHPVHYVKAGDLTAVDSQVATPKPAFSKYGAPIVPAPSNAAEPELESKPVQLKMPGSSQDAGKLAPPQPTRHQQELRRILDHPTRPGSLPPMSTPSFEDKKSDDKKLSETDMGWVD